MCTSNNDKNCISTPLKIGVCVATFERADVTKNCLEELMNAKCDNVELKFYVTDGGSTDDTVHVLEFFPNMNIAVHSNFYWNQSMRESIFRALKCDLDYILLLNDDTFLFSDALCELIATSRSGHNRIVVGETLNPITNEKSYGRLQRVSKMSRIRFQLAPLGNQDLAVTFNGNCVLIEKDLMSKLNNLNPHFSHAFGDIDLGLRATSVGIEICSPATAVGFCAPNSKKFLRRRDIFSLKRIKFIFQDPKGFPLREYLLFTRLHAGRLWVLNVVVRYAKLITGIEKV